VTGAEPINAIAVTPQEANAVAKDAAPPSPADRFRSDVSLNGEWRFAPAAAPAGKEPVPPADGDASWGTIGVPGSWMRQSDLRKKGAGPLWGDFAEEHATGRKPSPPGTRRRLPCRTPRKNAPCFSTSRGSAPTPSYT
jgi:hypothetical protein